MVAGNSLPILILFVVLIDNDLFPEILSPKLKIPVPADRMFYPIVYFVPV